MKKSKTNDSPESIQSGEEKVCVDVLEKGRTVSLPLTASLKDVCLKQAHIEPRQSSMTEAEL